MKLVDRRGFKTVAEAKRKVPYVEFLAWCELEAEKLHTQDKHDHQMALLTWQVYRLQFILSGTPEHTVEQFHIKYETKEPNIEKPIIRVVVSSGPKQLQAAPEDRKPDLAIKNKIMSAFGMRPDGKPLISGKPRLPPGAVGTIAKG